MSKRLSELKEAVNFHLSEKDEEEYEKSEFYDMLIEKYPELDIDESKPWLSTIDKEKFGEMLEDIVGKVDEPYKDGRKHIFLKFSTSGRKRVFKDFADKLSGDEKPKDASFIIATSPAATTDLVNFFDDMLLDHYELQEYIDYICKTFNAEEMTFEEFKTRARGNQVARESKVEGVVDFSEKTYRDTK